MYKALKKKQIKLRCAWRNFLYLVFFALKGLYCNDMHKSYSSKKQQPIHVYNTHFRYIDSNTPIKKLL